MSARTTAATKLVAELLRLPLSDIAEDWPRSMPKIALRKIAQQEERLKDCAWRVAEYFTEVDRKCAEKDARIAELEACLRERDGGDHDHDCRVLTSGYQRKADEFCTCGHAQARALLEGEGR